jgi:hypothetical protein
MFIQAANAIFYCAHKVQKKKIVSAKKRPLKRTDAIQQYYTELT